MFCLPLSPHNLPRHPVDDSLPPLLEEEEEMPKAISQTAPGREGGGKEEGGAAAVFVVVLAIGFAKKRLSSRVFWEIKRGRSQTPAGQ